MSTLTTIHTHYAPNPREAQQVCERREDIKGLPYTTPLTRGRQLFSVLGSEVTHQPAHIAFYLAVAKRKAQNAGHH